MATASDAEHYARLTRKEPRIYAGQQAAIDDKLLEHDLDARDLYGTREGPCVTVPEIFEATQTVTWEGPDGVPVYLRGPSLRGRLGTLVQRSHPWLKRHPELFQELRLPIDEPWPPPPPVEVPRRYE